MTTSAITPNALGAGSDVVKYAGFWKGAWRRFRRNFLAMYGLVFVIFIVTIAVFAPYVTGYPYAKIDLDHALETSSADHWLGTDQLGRDMMSRIVFAARPMLLVGILTQVAAMLIGVPLGIVAGYSGGIFDWVVTRLIDFFSALPWYLVVLYLIMLLRPSLENLIIALTITSWVFPCRIVRGLTLSVREQDYVEAAQALGIPTSRVLLYHVLPQALPLLLWAFAVGIPASVFAEAGLSFIGMGIRPPDPSWGQMLGESGQWWIYRPHMFVYPGMMIALSVLAFQGLADGLRTAIDVNVNI
jgi:ABC-type dipeptide/oligopeptide/nickel transport system permease subunit